MADATKLAATLAALESEMESDETLTVEEISEGDASMKRASLLDRIKAHDELAKLTNRENGVKQVVVRGRIY